MDHAPKPLVIVPSCNRELGGHPFHVAGRKYVDAVRLAGCQPLVLPPVDPADLDDVLDLAHGVLLTGSPSNVHPSHFGQDVHDPSLPLDPDRDAWTLALIPRAIERGIPLLGICRGTQETNVALGGTLHQAVQEVGPYADHRARGEDPVEVQYGEKHAVDVVEGGLLARIVDRPRLQVNSVHAQAVDVLAPGLRVEARAEDGLIEAFSAPQAPGFVLCLQWHPEWRAATNPASMQILAAFGQACRNYRERPRGPLP